MNIGIFVYDEAEVLDFSGPFEVFSTANRLKGSGVNVFLVGETGEIVTARGVYQVLPHYSFDTHPPIDLLVIVGGVHREVMHSTKVLNWVCGVEKSATRVASVCTGAFILANAGLLNGLMVTTHWEDIPNLIEEFPELTVVKDKRWVSAGKYTTSGGISAGIDMSLYLVSELYSPEFAEQVAHQMEYNWEQCT